MNRPRTPSATLLLPNRNNAHVLDRMLERLARHTSYPSFEVVAVDDGSTDRSPAILRRWRDSGGFRAFTLLERDHGGVVEALNAGLEASEGELVVQLDGDATVETPGWLERMADFYTSDDSIGVVTPLVTLDDGFIHAAGVDMIGEQGLHDRGSTPTEAPGARTVHTLVSRPRRETAGELVGGVQEVDCSIGVCMLYAREMARSVGGYDPGFSPVWFDDLDLSPSAQHGPQGVLPARYRGGASDEPAGGSHGALECWRGEKTVSYDRGSRHTKAHARSSGKHRAPQHPAPASRGGCPVARRT